MKTKRTARLHSPRDLRLHDESLPVAAPGESLLRVTAVGVCGSDLHWFSHAGIGDARLDAPLVLGHEFAGVVEGTGQRVAVDPLIACGECEPCREGNPHLCLAQRFAGHDRQDGALQEYLAWPIQCLHTLPGELTDEEGAMLEPLGVAIHALDLGQVQPDMTVGVFGCGPIGLLVLQVARLAGAAQLFATEMLEHRREVARALGAEAFLVDGEEKEKILTATKGRGVDVAFEAAGEDAALETALATVKPGGTVVLIGIPEDDRTCFPAALARRKEVTIRLVRRMKHTYPRAIELVLKRQVDVHSLVTHRFPLEQAAQAFAVAARREGIKVIVKM
jgi:L-iditol 2-dehydrogenase